MIAAVCRSACRTSWVFGRAVNCSSAVKQLTRDLSSTATEAQIKQETFENLRLIGINRPEKRNAVTHDMARRLLEAFQEFDADENAHAAVLYGSGGNFCSGYDLKELSQKDPEFLDDLLTSLSDGGWKRPMGPSLMRFSKPVVAAVEGYAVAGGLDLALMCDLRIAEDTTIFGAFGRRFGVPSVDGGSVRLPKLIGLSRALDMVLTGREVNGKTAFEWGLANRLVPTGAAMGQAVRVAQDIARFPQQSLSADRRSLFYSTFEASSLQDAFDFELKYGLSAVQTESIKGAKTFVEGIGKHGSRSTKSKPEHS